jgi:hypothetical protein
VAAAILAASQRGFQPRERALAGEIRAALEKMVFYRSPFR